MSRKLIRLHGNHKKCTIRAVYEETITDETVFMRDKSGSIVSGVIPSTRLIEDEMAFPNEKVYHFRLRELSRSLEYQEPRQ